jgi:hypothetical protein
MIKYFYQASFAVAVGGAEKLFKFAVEAQNIFS